MIQADIILRYPTIAALLLIAIFAYRDGKPALSIYLTITLSLCFVAILLTSAPTTYLLPEPGHMILTWLVIPNLAIFWWFCRSILEDNFRIGVAELLGFGLLCVINLQAHIKEALPSFPTLPFPPGSLTVAMIIHLLWLTISGWRDDLVATRRRARIWFVLWLLAASATSLIAEKVAVPGFDHELIRLMLISLTVFSILIGMGRLQLNQLLIVEMSHAGKLPPDTSKSDFYDYKKLVHVMEAKQAYLDPQLSIQTLAAQCNFTKHHLRTLINAKLGHRNFPAFVNTYRVEHAKALLRDPAMIGEQILIIGMDSGFASLATFNRVFKQLTAQTPSEYRDSGSRKCIETTQAPGG
jgi:AraC-like DNA-binding protein